MRSVLKKAVRMGIARRVPAWLVMAALATSCGTNSTTSAAVDVTNGVAVSAPAPTAAPSPTPPTTASPVAAPATEVPASASVDRPTKPQYIQMAEALCEEHHARTHEALRQWKIARGLNPDDLAPMELQEPMQKELIVPDIVAEFNELRALPRPLGDEAALQRWFDAFDAMAPAWKEDPVNDDHWIEVNAISQAYGINPDVC